MSSTPDTRRSSLDDERLTMAIDSWYVASVRRLGLLRVGGERTLPTAPTSTLPRAFTTRSASSSDLLRRTANAVALIERLDPDGVPGRRRFSRGWARARFVYTLPAIVEAHGDRCPVLRVCDPMHGNTFTADSGHKTRRFDDAPSEAQGFLRGARRPRSPSRWHPHRADR